MYAEDIIVKTEKKLKTDYFWGKKMETGGW